AFVDRERDAVVPGEGDEPREIALTCDGTLRVGGAAEIDHRGAREEFFRQCLEVGQEARFLRGGDVDRLRAGGKRGGGVALIEGVWHQNRRFSARFLRRGGDLGDVEKGL